MPTRCVAFADDSLTMITRGGLEIGEPAMNRVSGVRCKGGPLLYVAQLPRRLTSCNTETVMIL